MKVHTKVVYDMATMEVLEDEWYEYDGPVSECKGGGGGGTTINKTEPPEYLKPYLIEGANAASNQFNNQRPEFYPGNMIAPFSPETNMALDFTRSRALSGSPVANSAQDLAARTLQGEYLAGGEGFDRAYDAAMNRVTPMIDSKFESSGRYGSGLHKQALAQAGMDSFAGLYNQERGRQMTAMGAAPALSNLDYADMERLAQVGGVREQMAQDLINQDIARHDFYQNRDQQALAQYMGLLNGGNFGMTNTSTVPSMQRNRTAGALGGAASGAMYGTMIGGPGIGTAVGAIAGGLLGGF